MRGLDPRIHAAAPYVRLFRMDRRGTSNGDEGKYEITTSEFSLQEYRGQPWEVLMTIPLWVLLGFAAWTLLTLFTTVGVYRWTRILTGRVAIADWRADEPQGSEWYRRAVRAHMNCVENLPVYTALVVVLLAIHADTPVLDALAIIILVARIFQTVIHLALEQTNTVAALRFACFFTQALCMIAMGVIAAASAASS